jgi:hypothetical protein
MRKRNNCCDSFKRFTFPTLWPFRAPYANYQHALRIIYSETSIRFSEYRIRTIAKYKRHFTPHFYSFTVSLSPFTLSLHYPKFRTPQILSKFGVFLLKSTTFQPLSNIMEGKFNFCTHASSISSFFFEFCSNAIRILFFGLSCWSSGFRNPNKPRMLFCFRFVLFDCVV